MALVERDNADRALRLSQQQLLETNRELQRLTESDGLTGLSNRRSFDAFMARAWQASLNQTTTLSLLMIDVDFFKSYNDRLGHLAGDDALKGVADAIRNCRADPSWLAARFGGEEFALVLPAVSTEEAMAVAERLRQRVEAGVMPDAGPLAVTVSIGVATMVARPGIGFDWLIATADERLYQAKCQGRNRVVGP
jgi:two-component system chemotaxis family response regulator WspR